MYQKWYRIKGCTVLVTNIWVYDGGSGAVISCLVAAMPPQD
jgi:hypothetical protein